MHLVLLMIIHNLRTKIRLFFYIYKLFVYFVLSNNKKTHISTDMCVSEQINVLFGCLTGSPQN